MLNAEKLAETSPRSFLRCAVQHWYELREPGASFGAANHQRYVAFDNIDRWRRRNGTDHLRGHILSALKGERAREIGYLFFGAYYFPNEPLVEKFVMDSLTAARGDHRVAATYASIFFFEKNDLPAFLLSERVILEQEDKLVVRASRETLSVWQDAKEGGSCRLCGPTGTFHWIRKQPGLALLRK